MRAGTKARRHEGTKGRTGFTLVEMLIVIGVIVLLVGLTVAVIPAVGAAAERRETESTITVLAQAMKDWEITADRALSCGDDGNGKEFEVQARMVQPALPHVYSVSEVMRVIGRDGAVKSMIAAINPDRVIAYDSGEPMPAWLEMADDPDPNADQAPGQYSSGDWNGELTILDAWGQPIRAVHPGFVLQGQDRDGTVRTPMEAIYGVAANRNVFFVSAGPDRVFGIFGTDAAADNLYSYTPLDPGP